MRAHAATDLHQRSDVPATVVAPVDTLADFDAFCPSASAQPVAPCRNLSADGFLGSLTTFPPSGRHLSRRVGDFIHRFARGLYFRANYTFSKNIDNSTNELFSSYVNPRRAQDGFDFANERGRSALDMPSKFAITWVYDVPNIHNDHRFVRGVANGWEWSGTYLAQSGQPVTPLSGVDSNDNGDTAGDRTIFNPAGVGYTGIDRQSRLQRRSRRRNENCLTATSPTCAEGNIVGYVAANPTARFIQAGVGTMPNTGRDTVSTPGLNIWNMSIFKTNHLTERASIQFRFQTYNTFNHRNPEHRVCHQQRRRSTRQQRQPI